MRPRHPRQELENLLREAEQHLWTFSKGRKYFKGKCPCGLHLKTVHLTPSSSNYATNLKHWFQRQECWNRFGGNDV